MSMGMILLTVRDHLRDALSLPAAACEIQPGATPTPAAGEILVAIDEYRVESRSAAHLAEHYEIEVGIWRRVGQFPADRRGELLLPEAAYTHALQSLDVLERKVVTALHGNYEAVTQQMNTFYGLGAGEQGDIVQGAPLYRGRGRAEHWPPITQAHPKPNWLGRRLRFAGLRRVQGLDVAA